MTHRALFSTLRSSPCTRHANPIYQFSSQKSENTNNILARANKYLLPVYARPDLVLSHGKGSYVWDTEGRKFLDFSAGIAVNALGHADDQVAAVLSDQAGKLLHTSNVYHNEWAGKLAQLLVNLTAKHGGLGCEKGQTLGAKVFFSNSGTEANEGALKIARKVGKDRWKGDPEACKKTRILSFKNSFHGRSMGALSITNTPKYQKPFVPLVPGVDVGILNHLDQLERLVTDETCAVILEPIQGEGGVHPADSQWLKAVRQRCDEVGAVLIFDEIQCGIFRSGTLWAHSDYPVDCHPDIVTMAKPLANGYPVGAVLVKDAIAETMTAGTHGTTFGGSPLACAVGHHVLNRLSDPIFLERLADVSNYLIERLEHLPKWFPNIVQSTIRGRGLILGLGFKDEKHPERVVQLARERGVFLLTAGKDAVRIVPSLNIGRAEVDLAVDVLEGSLGQLQAIDLSAGL